MKPCPDTFPFPLVALDETASTNQYLSQLATGCKNPLPN